MEVARAIVALFVYNIRAASVDTRAVIVPRGSSGMTKIPAVTIMSSSSMARASE